MPDERQLNDLLKSYMNQMSPCKIGNGMYDRYFHPEEPKIYNNIFLNIKRKYLEINKKKIQLILNYALSYNMIDFTM